MADQIAYVGDTSGDEVLDVTFYERDVDGVIKDFVHIKIPGDKTVEVNVEADENYQRRFARRWEAYKNMQAIDCGTPIAEWDDVPQGLKDELRHQGFRFIEQVAGAGENAFSRIMGGIQWRTKAQAFLNRGKKSSEDVIKQQQEQIDLMQKQMAALLEAVQNNNLGEVKRGRKSKESTQTGTDTVESEE
jgi:hypothetical protein